MPRNNYKGFQRWTGLCKTKVPAEISAALEPIKDNDEAVRAYGIHLCTEMCKKILAHGINYLHLYSFNSDKSVLPVLENLGLIGFNQVGRSLWWRPTTNMEPASERCERSSRRLSGTNQ